MENLKSFKVPDTKSKKPMVEKYLDNSYKRGLKALHKNENGFMAASAVGILVLLVTLMLCALLFATLQGQTDDKIAALGDETANNSYINIKTAGWGSIDLFSLVPYVAVFIIILGMLIGLSKNAGGR